MSIREVSLGLISTVIMTGAFSSCYEHKYENKAKENAIQYLNKSEDFLKSERIAAKQLNPDLYNGEAIMYWDSLLIEAKSKEAYYKGMQVIKDSSEGKFFRKEKYKAPIDTVVDTSINLVDQLRNEYARYATTKDFIKARENAPEDFNKGINDLPYSIHYWNMITLSGKQNEAYQRGMVDARQELNNK